MSVARRFSFLAILVGLAALATLATAAATLADSSVDDGHGAKIVSRLGVTEIGGERVFVHVVVAVGSGKDAERVSRDALKDQGARPATPDDLQSAAFGVTGLIWDQFSDGVAGNEYVLQNYNPSRDPTGGAATAALKRSEATWTDVPSAAFVLGYGGLTSRCPSLVMECSGPQVFDGNNDTGWLRLSGRGTLAVTWYSTTRDEADMAVNTAYRWYAGTGAPPNRYYDLETVLLHENGHVAGLAHSSASGAVMEPYYEGVRRALSADDIAGLSYLYPATAGP